MTKKPAPVKTPFVTENKPTTKLGMGGIGILRYHFSGNNQITTCGITKLVTSILSAALATHIPVVQIKGSARCFFLKNKGTAIYRMV